MNKILCFTIALVAALIAPVCIATEPQHAYGITLGRSEIWPNYGTIYQLNNNYTGIQALKNFTFSMGRKDDNLSFMDGPFAIRRVPAQGPSQPENTLVYFSINCATAFTCLTLIELNMADLTTRQAPWALFDGNIHSLEYDSVRNRLIALHQSFTWNLILQEIDPVSLNIVHNFTTQPVKQFSWPQRYLSVMDDQENWIIQMRQQNIPDSIAFWVKFNMNKPDDQILELFTQFRGGYCPMTLSYDKTSKLLVASYINGTMFSDVSVFYVDKQSGKWPAGKIVTLLKIKDYPRDTKVYDIRAQYDSHTRIIHYLVKLDYGFVDYRDEYFAVEMDTLNIVEHVKMSKATPGYMAFFMV